MNALIDSVSEESALSDSQATVLPNPHIEGARELFKFSFKMALIPLHLITY
jgi:hypothetical protein